MQKAPSTEKDQLRNQLRVLEAADILIDQRPRTQGAKRWQFTLQLVSRTEQQQNSSAILAAIARVKRRPWSAESLAQTGLSALWSARDIS